MTGASTTLTGAIVTAAASPNPTTLGAVTTALSGYNTAVGGNTANIVSSTVSSGRLTLSSAGSLVVFATGSGTLSFPGTTQFAQLINNGSGGFLFLGTDENSPPPSPAFTFSGNVNTSGAVSGAAIYNTGTATIVDASFTMNSSISGPAIFNSGTATIVDSVFGGASMGNTASSQGGAILNSSTGTVAIFGSTFMSNTSSSGGAIQTNAGSLAIVNSNFTSNTATTVFGGGAIYSSGTITIANSNFTSNTATATNANGGAIYGGSGSVTVNGGSFLTNNAFSGGAIASLGGSVTVNGSGFSGNMATGTTGSGGFGGAIYLNTGTFADNGGTFASNTSRYGGAVYNGGGTATINGGNYSGNMASLYGGAIYNSGTATIDNADFTSNGSTFGGAITSVGSSGSMEISSSDFDGNTASSGGGAIYVQSGSLAVNGGEFSGNKTTGSGAVGGAIYDSSTASFDIMNAAFDTNMASSGSGGAIYSSAALDVTGGSFSGNGSQYGGGIYSAYGSSLTTDGTDFTGNIASSFGGAIYNSGGTDSITGGVFSGNMATSNNGGAIYQEIGSLSIGGADFTGNGAGYAGGAIYNENSGAPLTVDNTNFSGNMAGTFGGAIAVGQGNDVTITGGSFSGNGAGTGGGAIWNDFGDVTITGSDFNGNTASTDGGAIYNESGPMMISAATFTGNITDGIGGAIYNEAPVTIENGSTFTSNEAAYGGAIYTSAAVEITDGVFNENKATSFGGAIFVGAPITISGGSFSDNSSDNGGAMYVGDTTEITGGTSFSGNTSTAGNGGAIYNDSSLLTINGGDFNGNKTEAGDGGAIWSSGTLDFTNTNFENNVASGSGGAIYLLPAPATINGGTFSGNSATDGGAIYNLFGDLTIVDANFTGNIASALGGAIFDIGGTTDLSVDASQTSTFAGNTANGQANSIYFDPSGGLQNFNVDVANGGLLDMLDPMSGGNVAIAQTGDGVWALGGANIFDASGTGTTTFDMNAGTLYLYGAGQVGNATAANPSAQVEAGSIALDGSGSSFTLGSTATLIAGGDNSIAVNGLITLGNGATIRGGTSTDASFLPSGAALTNPVTSSLAMSATGGIGLEGVLNLQAVQLGDTFTLDANLADASGLTGSVVSSGAGIVILNGVSPFTGGTTVSSGTLVVGDPAHTSAALSGGGPIEIASGATLGGFGSVTGTVTNDGTLTAGSATPGFDTAPAAPFTIDGDLFNNATIDLASDPHTIGNELFVNGNYTAGALSKVIINTYLNAGGPLLEQTTDRLLVTGSVSGTTTDVVIHGSGPSGDTGDDNDDGISIIQVAGMSTPDAFVLPGGITNAGTPFEYTLNAFGPGSPFGGADPSQSLVGNPGGHWDYRLQSVEVDPNGVVTPEPSEPPGEVEPTPPPPTAAPPSPTPSPGEPEAPVPPNRPEVAPQIPAYLTAPVALFNSGFQDIDSLHRRLGEIRDDQILGLSQGSEVYFRGYGTSLNYTSNVSFTNFGFNSSQSYAALQLGFNWIALNKPAGTLRLGVAGTQGWLQYEPHAVDGASNGLFETQSLGLTATWQSRRGWYIDAIAMPGVFNGTVNTRAPVQAVRFTGTSFQGSLEVGYPIHLNAHGLELEPQLQFVYQHLNFPDVTDIDNIPIHIGNPTEGIFRGGFRLVRPTIGQSGSRFTPYFKADVLQGLGSGASVQFANVPFTTGNFGTAVQLGGGISGALSSNLAVHADVMWMESVGGEFGTGGSGFRGWAYNGELRLLL